MKNVYQAGRATGVNWATSVIRIRVAAERETFTKYVGEKQEHVMNVLLQGQMK